MIRRCLAVLAAAALLALPLDADDQKKDGPEKKDPYSADTFTGLELRGIGPALTSGRIVDLAVDPPTGRPGTSPRRAAACGRRPTPARPGRRSSTARAPTRSAASRSTRSNPLTVWVGTGENNSQRSVGYGDGVYKSDDGGESWKNVGLKDSEHIGKILDRPARLERRLRRGAGAALGARRRPRPLQDDRRRQDLEARARDQREHRRHRRRRSTRATPTSSTPPPTSAAATSGR